MFLFFLGGCLRRCRLKYLGVKYYGTTTYFQMVQQNVIYLNIEKKQMEKMLTGESK